MTLKGGRVARSTVSLETVPNIPLPGLPTGYKALIIGEAHASLRVSVFQVILVESYRFSFTGTKLISRRSITLTVDWVVFNNSARILFSVSSQRSRERNQDCRTIHRGVRRGKTIRKISQKCKTHRDYLEIQRDSSQQIGVS